MITGSHFLAGPLLFFGTSFLLAFALRFSQEWQRIRQEKKELQHEMSSAELMLLKKQLNPHFFFNTLNGIYAMIIKQSPFASKAVLQLSNMMRYILYDSDTDRIELSKEVKYIRDYIDVQKMRVTENNQIFFTVTGNFEDSTIFPLLFIPFVENAFKYGISSDRDTVIVISIAIKENLLDFTCINDIVTKNDKSVHSGIGLKNTIKRLEIVYANKHELTTMQADNKYIVKLKVELPC